ncbi:hypothetical protein CANCADRAFT_30079 [Tortispora caseinolytica NRRL Y-17796]|uniref:BSD domain-containing protein n=1 Tax=Tortispora caseinolytica NRRL Y-17796 TaxID=767744 RepID=A0A1E4TJ34_9ASCO|nr:hypothetical protein CANCADRAFT_30079 [Tortispora caseinolytica NRRL Y-17796]
MVSAPALVKKEPGLLYVTETDTNWVPDGTGAGIFVALKDVAALQAKAADKKSMLRITTSSTPPATHTFTFTDNQDFETCKAALQSGIARARAGQTQVGGKSDKQDEGYAGTSDKQLLADVALQQGLLRNDDKLRQMFETVVIHGGVSATEFWSARLDLLRRQVLSNTQKRGAYNVLSSINPATGSENKINLSLSREIIKDILEMYPTVAKAYNQNVPPLSESDFWAQFFASRLFRYLRGEKLSTSDAPNPIFDKYIGHSAETIADQQPLPVSFLYNVDANEQDNSERYQAATDMTMKPDAIPSTLPMLSNINTLSARILHNVSDYSMVDPTTQAEREDALELHDLDIAPSQEYLLLKIDRAIQPALPPANGSTAATAPDTSVSTVESLEYMRKSLDPRPSLEHLADDNELYEEVIASLSKTIQARVKETTQQRPNIDAATLEEMRLTHATASEFLHHFWIDFNSGDASKAAELSKIVESLTRSNDRITAILDTVASEQRQHVLDGLEPLREGIQIALKRYQTAFVEQRD